MKNLMKQYMDEKATEHSKAYAKAQIDIAHRIMEYLIPDPDSPRAVSYPISREFLQGNITAGVDSVMEEVRINSQLRENDRQSLREEAMEFAQEAYKERQKRDREAKIEQRKKLAEEIARLDKELGIEGENHGEV